MTRINTTINAPSERLRVHGTDGPVHHFGAVVKGTIFTPSGSDFSITCNFAFNFFYHSARIGAFQHQHHGTGNFALYLHKPGRHTVLLFLPALWPHRVPSTGMPLARKLYHHFFNIFYRFGKAFGADKLCCWAFFNIGATRILVIGFQCGKNICQVMPMLLSRCGSTVTSYCRRCPPKLLTSATPGVPSNCRRTIQSCMLRSSDRLYLFS
jgi:hypothetical protein